MSSIQSFFPSFFSSLNVFRHPWLLACHPVQSRSRSPIFWPTKETFYSSLTFFQVLQFAQVLASFGMDSACKRPHENETETSLPFIYLSNLLHSLRSKKAVYPNNNYPSFINCHWLFSFGWFHRNTSFSVIWQALTYPTAFLKTLWILRLVLVWSTFFVSFCAKVNVS